MDQDIEILNCELETAMFANLTSVGDDVIIESNPFLFATSFSALLAIPGDLYIANNQQFLSANFMRVTRIDGSLSLINNKVLTSVVLSALTTIGGGLFYDYNPQLARLFPMPSNVRYTVLSSNCASSSECSSGRCWTMSTDVLSCSVIAGGRSIEGSSASSLVNPVLTRAEGWLYIQDNKVLNRIDFAALTYVGGLLAIQFNPALTFASLPRVSQVQEQIYFCQNAPNFRIPNAASGTAAPPGLTSVLFKDQAECNLQQGSASCATVTCP